MILMYNIINQIFLRITNHTIYRYVYGKRICQKPYDRAKRFSSFFVGTNLLMFEEKKKKVIKFHPK